MHFKTAKKKTWVAVTIRIQTNLYETKTEFNIITHNTQTEKFEAMVRFNGCHKGNGNEKVKVFALLYLWILFHEKEQNRRGND